MSRSYAIRVANCAAVSAPRQADHCAILAMTKAGEYGVPDVVLFSEVSPVNLSRLVLIHAVGAEVVQYGEAGSPEAGVGIVSRLPIVKRSTAVGSARTSEGGGIRMRPFARGKVRRLPWLSAGHAAPPRAPVARALYLARARTLPGIVGADWNSAPRWMRQNFVRQYRGIGVLGLLVPRTWKVSVAHSVDVGSDHPAVDVRIERRRARA